MVLRKVHFEKCCASGIDSRTALSNPYFDGRMVIATDGKVLISVRPESIEPDDIPGPIPRRVFTEKVSSDGFWHIKLTATHAIINDIHFPRDCEGIVYPDWEKVVPSHEDYYVLGINTEFLKRISGSFNTTNVELLISKSPLQGILVRPIYQKTGYNFETLTDAALIMPIRCDPGRIEEYSKSRNWEKPQPTSDNPKT
jgi:hypothetical protein